MKNKVMNLYIVFIIIITLFSMSGCGKKEDQITENNINDVNKEISVVEQYKEFIINKEYEKDEKDLFATAVDYKIIDINQDGTEELFIQDDYSNEFHNVLMYTFDRINNQVKYIDLIYAYMGIRYNQETKEMMYTPVRPYGGIGGYTFYKLENDSLVETKMVSQNVNEYTLYTPDGKQQSITAEERDRYYDGYDYLEYTKISTLQVNNSSDNTNTIGNTINTDNEVNEDAELKAGDFTLKCGTYSSSIGMDDKLGGVYIIKPDYTYIHKYTEDSKTIESEGTFKIYYYENEPGTLIESMEGWTIQFTPNNSDDYIGTFNITRNNHFEAEQYANYFDLLILIKNND